MSMPFNKLIELILQIVLAGVVETVEEVVVAHLLDLEEVDRLILRVLKIALEKEL